MSEWFLTRLGAGTIGPLGTDSVLEGIADGRVPPDTTARAVGDRVPRALAEIPVFEAAVRVARPLGPAPEPFEGLVEAEHDRRAQLREERAQQRQLETGARLRRMTAPFRQRHAARLVAFGALLGGAIGVAFAAFALPQPRADLLSRAPAIRTAELATLRIATRLLAAPAAPAPAPAPSPSPAPPAPEPPPTAAALESLPPPPAEPIRLPGPMPAPRGARAGATTPAQSFSVDPLNAPLTPPLGPPHTP